MKNSLCARYCPKHFTCMNSFNPHTYPEEKTKAKRD